MKMDVEFIDNGEYDYRCIYTVNGIRFCTDSLNGVSYEKEPEEVLDEMPNDIELNPDQTYTALELADSEDPFSGWYFELTFAEGEWKKE